MKKVLIITYYWPPAGGPGVQRWLKFSKYLPANGIDPIILTVDPTSATYPILDESLEKEVGNLKVFKTPTREFFGAYKKATSRKEVPYSGFASESSKPNLKERIARFIRGNFFYPDPRRGWKKFALPKALEIIQKENVEVVITTGPPHSTHLIGLEIKKQTGIKWLADFRDPWTDIYYYQDFYPTTLTRKLESAMESQVLHTADMITAASPGFAKMLAAKLKGENKIFAITNGFDDDDMLTTDKPQETQQFEITYTGTLTAKYPLSTLVSAIKILDRKIQEVITLNIVGKIDQTSADLLKDPRLYARVNLAGYVSHDKAMEYLMGSKALLLLIPILKGNEGIIPAKLFEYIGAGKQIVCIGPKPSDAASIIAENSFGATFIPTEIDELSRWLKTALTTDSQKNSQNESRKKFSRSSLTKKLSVRLTDL